MGRRFGDADLLHDAGFVRASPALCDLAVGVELCDLDAAGLDLFASGGNALEGAVLGAGDGVGNGDAVVIGCHVLDCDLEVGEGAAELGEELDEALGAVALIGSGIVIFHAGCEDVVKLFQPAAVDGVAHFLGGCDVRLFAHDASGAVRCGQWKGWLVF